MKVGISSIRTKDMGINRHELINKLQTLGHSVTYIGRDSDSNIHQDYERFQVPFLTIPLGRSNTNPFKEIETIIKTKQVLKENEIDVLISYGIRTFPTMVVAARLAGVKKVLCIVNGSGRLFQLTGIKGFLVKCISYPMLWIAFLLSDSIFFQNPDDKNMIKGKGLLWKRNYETINGSGVNLEEYPFCKLERKPVFSMISRLTGSKGVNEYIQAASYVKQKYPEASFYLIGPIDEEDFSINMIELQKSVKNGIINLIGKVDDVRPYIIQSRIFVLPSYYPEGIPRSILEAMAMGRPIITNNSPGCRETVIDGKNGFLIQPKDVKELSDKMIWMINNEDPVLAMGKYSREICEEKFDIHKINNLMLAKLFQ
ncbi:glycosyltransferase family 1 protein [Sporosarcina sp. P19]|uniref:glycosyltransferase family 4 protein n=1 Tax=Sporosarcina sp. P19 TaxID=2048258 RepID=UPI000C1713C0|nr:glycosyltransferase family 4 protein [Sporosarcina sp. P19]PIC77126.1 glycosyltransferase family 1 protein [Sporosarcina sp. P19]